jgi:hypothetical protein
MTTTPQDDLPTGDTGIVVLLLGADPGRDRFTVAGPDGSTTVVAVGEPARAGAAAAGLVDEGVGRIELCGGLGPETAGRVAEAVAGRVPVGAVSFGIDAVDAAQRFRDRIAAGIPMRAGFVYRRGGLDAAGDRRELDLGGLVTAFVPVARDEDVVDAALALVEEGSELVELYHGVGQVTATRVIDAVAGRAAVGVARSGPA